MRNLHRLNGEIALEAMPGRPRLAQLPRGTATATGHTGGAVNPAASFDSIGLLQPWAAALPRGISGRDARRTDSAPARDAIEAYAMHAFAANGFGDANVGRAGQRLLQAGDRLDQGAAVPRSSRMARIVEATLRAVGAIARRIYSGWKRQKQASDTYFALRELDAHTLRDLGFDRSEIRSVAAEIAGDADPTRVLTVQALRGRRY